MAYTPNNNPYVPGDPYSYDLKWIVSKIKAHDSVLENLPAQIQAAVIAALDQHDPVYYNTAAELIASGQKAGSIAYIEGFHAAGDGGANLYYVTDDYNDIIGANFYLTMNTPNLWALPVILTPYVTPEMFGAYGDGTSDDSGAFDTAFKYHAVCLCPGKSYGLAATATIDPDGGSGFVLYGNNASLVATTPLIKGLIFAQNVTNITISDVLFIGTGDNMTINNGWNYYGAYIHTCDHTVIKGCSFDSLSSGGVFIVESSYVKVKDCSITNVMNDNAGGCIVVGYGINAADMGHIEICGNTCISGHFGIECQGWLHDIVIADNYCDGQYGYGILGYLDNTTPTQVFENVIVKNNTVLNTHYNPASGYYNGMAIYMQTVGKLHVIGNTIRNALLDRPDTGSPNRTLTPGAIALGGSYDYIIADNIIDSSTIDGISGSNIPDNNTASIITNNTIKSVGTCGIYINPISHLTISYNRISDCGSAGIGEYGYPGRVPEDIKIIGNSISNSGTGITVTKLLGTTLSDIEISGNMLSNTKTSGISMTYTTRGRIYGNSLIAGADTSQTAGYAIYTTDSTDIDIRNNVVGGTVNFFGGIYINTNTNTNIIDNVVKSILSSARLYAVYTSANTIISGNVDIINDVRPQTTGFNLSADPTTGDRVIINANAAPATGTYTRGSICFNTLPASGSPIGWICTATGTPGTWVAMPNL